MSEQSTRDPALEDEAQIGQLLNLAGERPALPAKDLGEIAAAAHAAWKEQLAMPSGEAPASERPWIVAPARQPRAGRMAWGLAAALVATVGVAGWWLAGRGSSGSAAARVESVLGDVTLEAAAGSGRPSGGKSRVEPAQAVPVGSRLATAGELNPAGSEAGGVALRLAGGAAVRLAEGTRARLLSARRIELESGALYVDSAGAASGAETQVEIQTAIGWVREIGTQFSVRTLSDVKRLEVRVREGEIQVQRRGDTVAAMAGSELVLGAEGPVGRRPISSHGADWDWVLDRAPAYAIEGRTLSEFLRWIGRETGWRIELSAAASQRSVGEVVLHGRITGLRPDRAAQVVLSGAELSGEVVDGTLRIDLREGAGH